MRDRLPDIDVRPDVQASVFLDRCVAIANRQYDVEVERAYTGQAGYDLASIRSRDLRGKLSGQLLVDPANEMRVAVEMRGSAWNPTYEEYVRAVKEMFGPLLSHYNAEYHSRCRLRVQSKSALEPQLPEMAKAMFDAFVICANKQALHPLDWRRFYEFVIHCHRVKVGIDTDGIQRLLIQGGFDAEYATRIALIYSHGRDLLAAT